MTTETKEFRVAVSALAQRVQGLMKLLETWLTPLLDLTMRLWIARIFFNSGLTKVRDWDSTLFLFEYEYQVPILPHEVAAFFGTAIEIVGPVLLVLGLAARLGALPMLAMALVIQFALGSVNPAYANIEHFYWMFVLAMIVARGPGRLSLDHYLVRRFVRDDGWLAPWWPESRRLVAGLRSRSVIPYRIRRSIQARGYQK